MKEPPLCTGWLLLSFFIRHSRVFRFRALISVIPGLTGNLLCPIAEPPVAKTASCALNCDICPLEKWGLEQLGAYKGDFATRTSDLKRSVGKVLRSAEGRRLHAGFGGLARCREGA